MYYTMPVQHLCRELTGSQRAGAYLFLKNSILAQFPAWLILRI